MLLAFRVVQYIILLCHSRRVWFRPVYTLQQIGKKLNFEHKQTLLQPKNFGVANIILLRLETIPVSLYLTLQHFGKKLNVESKKQFNRIYRGFVPSSQFIKKIE